MFNNECSLEGYKASDLMKETAKIRQIITKRGTMEILIPLCCSTNPVRYKEFRQLLKGFSSKTLARRLKELENGEILERQAYNEIPPRVEYRLTPKGQELVQSIINLLQWMRKWSKSIWQYYQNWNSGSINCVKNDSQTTSPITLIVLYMDSVVLMYEQKMEKKVNSCIVFYFTLTYYNLKAFMLPSGTI